MPSSSRHGGAADARARGLPAGRRLLIRRRARQRHQRGRLRRHGFRQTEKATYETVLPTADQVATQWIAPRLTLIGRPRTWSMAQATSATHDIIVIGGSGGALEALRTLARDFPPDLPAAVFVVLHMGASSHLAYILTRSGPLPTVPAASGERF